VVLSPGDNPLTSPIRFCSGCACYNLLWINTGMKMLRKRDLGIDEDLRGWSDDRRCLAICTR